MLLLLLLLMMMMIIIIIIIIIRAFVRRTMSASELNLRRRRPMKTEFTLYTLLTELYIRTGMKLLRSVQ